MSWPVFLAEGVAPDRPSPVIPLPSVVPKKLS
jgi:hypothetical protein